MSEPLFGIPNFDIYIVVGILIFFILVEIVAGYWHKSKRSKSDWAQEMFAFGFLSLVTKPAIVLTAVFIGQQLFPSFAYALNGSNIWLTVLLYVLIDDFLQYWYHRSAHEYPFLWKLHRTHHQATEMGFFVSYRNAALYYILMPNLWWVGCFVFLGGLKAVAIGLILKQLVIISSHSQVKYDAFLYKHKILRPLAFLIERILITPSFHHIHHGKTKRDGISDPNGNFGNMFSIWDQLFGTATFNRKYPLAYGLENDPREHWTAAYLYPFVKAKNPESEISKNYEKQDTRSLEPAHVYLIKGEKYLYCQCGMSKNQPFCDSSHHGTKFKPLLFEAQKTGKTRLCNCKKTGASPFCDDSHLKPD